MSQRLLIAGAVVLALALLVLAAVVGVPWWQNRDRTELERALAWAPAGSERFAWTDWDDVRRELGADLDGTAKVSEVEALLSAGFDADLTSTSSMVDSAAALHTDLGFSPAVVEWELLSQSEDGAVVTMGLPEDAAVSALGDRFEELGFERPEDPDGVWVGGDDLLAQLDALISPQFAHLALDEDRRLLLASDSQDYLETALDAVDGDGAFEDEGVLAVADAAGEPLSAALYTGGQACRALAMAQADPSDQATAEELVAAAGEVNPLTGFAIAAQPGGDVLVAMAFENHDQARRNADSRAVLASGPAPGQGGEFADRFELGTVQAKGDVVTMELLPTEGSYVLSDLSSGPVLFATC